MKIIIEGCDGSGKSTLANRLAKLFNCEVEHDSKPYDVDTYLKRLKDGKNTIYDRFFLGQFVYNNNNDRKLSIPQLCYLKDYCITHDIILLYVEQDDEIILERLNNRTQEEKEHDAKTMKMVGVSDTKEFVKLIKGRYNLFNSHFTVIHGGNFKDE